MGSRAIPNGSRNHIGAQILSTPPLGLIKIVGKMNYHREVLMDKQLQLSARAALPAGQQNSSALTASSERLNPSEALSIAADLLSLFPNCKAEDGFIRALAQELFMRYPASVVHEIADAFTGLPAITGFLSIDAAKKWLDQRCKPLFEQAEHERRALAPPEPEWIDKQKAEEAQNIIAKNAAWLTRKDPRVRELMAAAGKGEIEHQRQAELLTKLKTANDRYFERECAAAGIDPARGVSPSLLRTLES